MFNELVGRYVTVESCEMRYALINGHWSRTVDRETVKTDCPIRDLTDGVSLAKELMKAVIDEFEENYFFEVYDADSGELLFKVYLDSNYNVMVEKF